MGEVTGGKSRTSWTRLKAVWPATIAAGRAAGAWPLRRLLLWTAATLALLYILVLAASIVSVRYLAFQIPHNPPVNHIVYLDQGWGSSVDSPKRQFYYYTPQGTSVVNLRYSWFVHLEQADSSERFAAPSHMRALGFIVDNAQTPDNPDQLPVGFTKHFDTHVNEEFLDITCAACHTAELHTVTQAGEQVAIRVDGGPAMQAFGSAQPGQFGPALLAALTSTLLNPWKFNRFARNVLEDHYQDGKWHLRVQLFGSLTTALKTAFSDVIHGKYPIDEGFGRIDAIAHISNKVFGDEMDDPDNYVKGTSPVRYPHLWNATKFDWAQYTGSVAQPLARNLGEALGVGATAEFVDPYGRPVAAEHRFPSDAPIETLVKLEETIDTLSQPTWPSQILGAVDEQKKEHGRQLYVQYCQRCHEPCLELPFQAAVAMPLRPATNPLWRVHLTPIEQVGTDPQTALNFFNYRVNLEKTGLTAADVGQLLGAELREREFRKQHFQNLNDDYARWKAANPSLRPSEQEFLRDADRKRRQDHQQMEADRLRLRKQGLQPALSPQAQAEIQKQLDAINIQSTTIGQGLNYVGLFIRDRYFREHAAQLIARAPVELGAELSSWYSSSTDNDIVQLYEQELRESMNGWGALDLPQVFKVYKALPLGGAWATAPYLHNGSVPNLYELLLPAERRSKKFFISRMNFDPVRVGLATEPTSDKGYWLDTSIPGNLNIGHEFRAGYGGGPGGRPSPGVVGPELTDEERWDLIEYLKVHVDQPALCESEYKAPAGGYQ